MTFNPVNAECVESEYKPLSIELSWEWQCDRSDTTRTYLRLGSKHSHIVQSGLASDIQSNIFGCEHQGNCRDPKPMGNLNSPGQAVSDPEDPGPDEITQLETVPSPHPPVLPPAEHDTRGQETQQTAVEAVGVEGGMVQGGEDVESGSKCGAENGMP